VSDTYIAMQPGTLLTLTVTSYNLIKFKDEKDPYAWHEVGETVNRDDVLLSIEDDVLPHWEMTPPIKLVRVLSPTGATGLIPRGLLRPLKDS
jgi:hypothetical protein